MKTGDQLVLVEGSGRGSNGAQHPLVKLIIRSISLVHRRREEEGKRGGGIEAVLCRGGVTSYSPASHPGREGTRRTAAGVEDRLS